MSVLDTLGITRKITRPRLRAFLERHATDAHVLDVGSGNGPYKELFPNRTTLEIEERDGHPVDIVGDAHDLHMIEDTTYDVILLIEVLEHLHTPSRALSELHRILKPGGKLILSTRFVFPIHDAPGDYYRYTKYGLRHLLKDFDIEECEEETSTIETLGVLLQRIGFQCETLWLRPFKLIWFLLAKLTLLCSWMLTNEYGDISHRNTEQHIMSSGYYVSAVKKTAPAPDAQ